MPRRPERRLLLGAAAAPPSFLVLLVCRRALVLLLFGLGEVGARLVVVRGGRLGRVLRVAGVLGEKVLVPKVLVARVGVLQGLWEAKKVVEEFRFFFMRLRVGSSPSTPIVACSYLFSALSHAFSALSANLARSHLGHAKPSRGSRRELPRWGRGGAPARDFIFFFGRR